MDKIGQMQKLAKTDKLVQYGQTSKMWTKLNNMDKLGKYGQTWTIWTSL